MATSFPSGLDSFTNPTAVDTLDSPPHDTQHADANDAIEALQAKVGVDGSAVTTSIDYQLNTGYRYHSTVYFTSSGSFTKASYPWLRAVKVRLVGGGGGGNGTVLTAGASGNGGGGGGYAESFITNIAGLSASETVTVGAGGSGGPAGAFPTYIGTAGGASSFGSLVAASGGSAGADGSPGGVGTAGDLLIRGEAGGGGGLSSDTTAGGTGGSSLLGGGGVGPVGIVTGGITPGGGGGSYGGGGGGGMARASTGTYGGNGAAGIVIVELYA